MDISTEKSFLKILTDLKDAVKTLGVDKVGLEKKSTLTSNEEKIEKKKGEIYANSLSKVLKPSISNIASFLSEKIKYPFKLVGEKIQNSLDSMKKSILKPFKSIGTFFSGLNPFSKKEDSENPDNKKKQDKNLFKGVNLAGLGAGLKLIVENLVAASKINTDAVTKAFKCINLFTDGIGKFMSVALKIGIGIGALGLMTVVIDYMLKVFKKFQVNLDWVTIAKNLAGATIAVGLIGGLAFAIGSFVFGTAGVAGFAILVGAGLIAAVGAAMWVVGKSLKAFDEVDPNHLKELGWALMPFGAGLIAFCFGIVSATAGAAIEKLMKFFFDVDIVESIKKFETLNSSNLVDIGKGLESLSGGLKTFLFGIISATGAGAIDRISSFFGMDPASLIAKFSKLDGESLIKVGSGLTMLSQGLISLTSVSGLRSIVSDITAMVKPISLLSDALDKFIDSYSKLDKLSNSAAINVKVSDDNSIQSKLVELNTRELEIHIRQLDQLKENGEILKEIALKINNSTTKVVQVGSNDNKSEPTVMSPSFSTKNNFIGAMNMSNMSLAG